MKVFKVYKNNVDFTSRVQFDNCNVLKNLTREPDTFNFKIKLYRDSQDRLLLGDKIFCGIYDDVLNTFTTYLFNGVVVNILNEKDDVPLTDIISITCKDDSVELGKILVVAKYTNMSVRDIIINILLRFAPNFNQDNTFIVAPDILASISFNFLTIPQCLQKITETIAGYDWYLSIQLVSGVLKSFLNFSKTALNQSSFQLLDNSSNYIYDSLSVENDLTQIRNSIIVRGASTASSMIDDNFLADGVRKDYALGLNLQSRTFYRNTGSQASPVWVLLTVGVDGVNDINFFDALWNEQTYTLRFKIIPIANTIYRYTGNIETPIITQRKNLASIAKYGEYQHTIINSTLSTLQEAFDVANAELLKYQAPPVNVNFTSYWSNIKDLELNDFVYVKIKNSDIDGFFKVATINYQLRLPTPNAVDDALIEASITLVSTLPLSLVAILNKLLTKDKESSVEDERLDAIYGAVEELTFTESLTIGIKRRFSEDLFASDTYTQDNNTRIYVLTPITIPPVGFLRPFCLDLSPML